jgi:hypothetical protein
LTFVGFFFALCSKQAGWFESFTGRSEIGPMNHRLLFFIFLSLFVACDKDNDDPMASILGMWQGDRAEILVNYGFITVYDDTDEEFDVTIEFREDGTVSFTKDGNVTNGTYELKANKLTTDVDLQLYEMSGPTTFDVIELSDKKLRLRLKDKQTATIPDVGEVELDVNATLDFDRL